MAKQFSQNINAAQASVQLDENIAAQPDTIQICSWLTRLQLLYGIPFHYLVPDIRMLPQESIRFFEIDENWIAAVTDGAYSPGTTAFSSQVSNSLQSQVVNMSREQIAQERATMLNEAAANISPGIITGFFLRSSAVSGWPGMQVQGWDDTSHSLTILRMEQISPSVLLCLFAGKIARVDFTEPQEGLYSSFDYNESNSSFTKPVRYASSNGNAIAGTGSGTSVTVQMRNSKNVVNVSALAQSFDGLCWAQNTPVNEQNFTSAEFGLEMIQNMNTVSFHIS